MKNEKDERVKEQLESFDTGCKFKLENFEGPLDLLLHLIKEAKVEITEVKLADITEQYLEYMSGLDELDLEKASDFIDIAATLIEIKSKSLLPRVEEVLDEEEDPETVLLRQIKEYKLFKETSEKLKEQEDVNKFYKSADETVNDYRYVLKEMNIDGLLNAFAKMLTKVKKEAEAVVPRKIEKDRFTVAEKIISIRQNLQEKRSMHFSEFFEEDYTLSEMINLFSAVLELAKMQEILVKQQATYEDIDIELREKEVSEVQYAN